MQCLESGQVLVLPHKVLPHESDAESWVERAADEMGAGISLDHSTEDVLRHYHLERKLEDLRDGGAALPLVVRVPEGEELWWAHRLREMYNVRAAVPNFLITPLGGPSSLVVNEPFLDEALALVGCDDPGQDGPYGSGVNVAILDTGVNPDLLRHGHNLHNIQYDTHDPSQQPGSPPSDPEGHGSLSAHIVDRIAPGAQVLSVRSMGGYGTVGGLINALIVAHAAFRPDIYNLSLAVACDFEWCKSCGNPLGHDAAINVRQLAQFFEAFDEICDLRDERPLLVAAAGNDRGAVLMPASFANVVAVGSFDTVSEDAPSYAQYAQVPEDRFFLAPGGLADEQHALATKPGFGGRASFMKGTSFAAPFVVGIAARYLSEGYAGATAIGPVREQLVDVLQGTAMRTFPSYTTARHGLGLARYMPYPPPPAPPYPVPRT